jgi:hypothetical protein
MNTATLHTSTYTYTCIHIYSVNKHLVVLGIEAYLCKFCDDAELVLCLKSVQQDDDVWMIQFTLDINLLPKVSEIFFRLAVLGYVLESYNLTKQPKNQSSLSQCLWSFHIFKKNPANVAHAASSDFIVESAISQETSCFVCSNPISGFCQMIYVQILLPHSVW